MKAKKIVALLLAVMMVFAFTACSNNQGNDGGTASGDKPYIAVVSKGFQHQFWQVVHKGAQAAADQYGVDITFEGPPSESDIGPQVDMLKSALAKNPSAICLAALDTDAVIEQLNQAKTKNIPVIGFDSGIPNAPEGTVAANASTDNYKAAEIAAEQLFASPEFIAALEKGTEADPVLIPVLSQDATSESIINRTAGFVDKLKSLIEEKDGFKDAVEVTGHTTFAKKAAGTPRVIIDVGVSATTGITDTTTTATQALSKPNVIAIYCSNNGTVDGLLAATNDGADFDKTNGKYKDILAVGFDSGKGQKNAVANGWFYGSVTQDPYSIGFKAVELAYKAYMGEQVSDVDTGAKWYNKDNINSEEIKDLLYD